MWKWGLKIVLLIVIYFYPPHLLKNTGLSVTKSLQVYLWKIHLFPCTGSVFNSCGIISCLMKLKIKIPFLQSVQFSCSVVFDSLRPHESQHAKPPCPSPNPGVHPNSCALSQWCHPAISSSVVPFSSCPQSLPASEFFQSINTSHDVV